MTDPVPAPSVCPSAGRPASSAAARDFWNHQGQEWVETLHTPKMVRRQATMVQFIERHCSPCSCLDIGCGDGSICLELATRGYDVYGCDVSDKLVESSIRLLAPVVADAAERFTLIENNRIPFGRTFDLICLLGVLVYIPDHVAYLRQIAGRLNPGGLLVATCTQRASLRAGWNVVRNLRRPSLDPGWRTGLLNLVRTGIWSGGQMPYRGSGRIYSARGLERALVAAGFEPIDRFSVYDFERLDRDPLGRSGWASKVARGLGWRQTVAARLGPSAGKPSKEQARP